MSNGGERRGPQKKILEHRHHQGKNMYCRLVALSVVEYPHVPSQILGNTAIQLFTGLCKVLLCAMSFCLVD